MHPSFAKAGLASCPVRTLRTCHPGPRRVGAQQRGPLYDDRGYFCWCLSVMCVYVCVLCVFTLEPQGCRAGVVGAGLTLFRPRREGPSPLFPKLFAVSELPPARPGRLSATPLSRTLYCYFLTVAVQYPLRLFWRARRSNGRTRARPIGDKIQYTQPIRLYGRQTAAPTQLSKQQTQGGQRSEVGDSDWDIGHATECRVERLGRPI